MRDACAPGAEFLSVLLEGAMRDACVPEAESPRAVVEEGHARRMRSWAFRSFGAAHPDTLRRRQNILPRTR